jgi:site-specific recombinase XerD
MGKRRKERCTPLRKDARHDLRLWLRERQGQPCDVLFPSARGRPLSRDGVEYLLAKHVAAAEQVCASLKTKRVSPHVLRHSLAMDLLQSGVDRSVIALWLGHESMDTVQVYFHASLALKEQALAKTRPHKKQVGRYRPGDKLMAFLQGL